MKEKRNTLENALIDGYILGSTAKPDHRSFILQTLDDWFGRHRHALNLPTATFVVEKDFQVALAFNGASDEARIICSCGARVQLTKMREHFSLSNYYKHVKSKSCTMMKNKRADHARAHDTSSVVDDEETPDDIAAPSAATAAPVDHSSHRLITTASSTADSSKRLKVSHSQAMAKRIRIR